MSGNETERRSRAPLRRCLWRLLPPFLLALAAAPASANMYVPSLVEFLAAPTPWSLIYPPAVIITGPVLLAISFLEWLVLRRYARAVPAGLLFIYLLGLNTLTSLLGAYAMSMGTRVWPGFPLAFALTVVLEAVALGLAHPRRLTARAWSTAARASFWMNAASYAAMGGVLFYLVYVPTTRYDNRAVKAAASGTVLLTVDAWEQYQAIQLSVKPSTQKDAFPGIPFPAGAWSLLPEPTEEGAFLYTLENGALYELADGRAVARWRYQGREWIANTLDWSAKLDGLLAVSRDERVACCRRGDAIVIIDTASGQTTCSLDVPAGRLTEAALSYDGRFLTITEGIETTSGDTTSYHSEQELVDLTTGTSTPLGRGSDACFSPVDARLAWVTGDSVHVRDCLTGATREIDVPGVVASNLAWSSDGSLLGYLGSVNRYTYRQWAPDVCAVRLADGSVGTLRASLPVGGVPPPKIHWLP